METQTIDWEEVRGRLKETERALSAGFEPDREAKRRILEERAKAASMPSMGSDGDERMEVLAFSLGRESYGIETAYVQEAAKLKDLTVLPCTPPFIAGVTNWGGRILAVVNLGEFFGLPMKGLGELSQVIVIRGGKNEFGLLADSIDGVKTLRCSEFLEGPGAATDRRGKFLKGIDGRMMALLDGKLLLEDEGLKVNEEAGRGGR